MFCPIVGAADVNQKQSEPTVQNDFPTKSKRRKLRLTPRFLVKEYKSTSL